MVETAYWRLKKITVLETEIDDMTGELLGHVLEEALRRGALDANFTPVQMKKNRPGTRLTLLCEDSDRDRFLDFLFRETTSLGVRIRSVQRAELERDAVPVEQAGHRFSVKRGLGTDGEMLNEAPEFEDLRSLARQERKPLKRLFQKWFGREDQRDDQ